MTVYHIPYHVGSLVSLEDASMSYSSAQPAAVQPRGNRLLWGIVTVVDLDRQPPVFTVFWSNGQRGSYPPSYHFDIEVK